MKLCIDPGIRHCGVAVIGPELQAARLIKNPARKGGGVQEVMRMASAVAEWAEAFPVDYVITERMQVRLNSPGNPNTSLLPLFGVAYAITAMFPGAIPIEYLPSEWKGSVDGIACTVQVRERLSPAEHSRIELPDSACAECRKHHSLHCAKGSKGCGADHVYDAVGLGLKHSSRFERKRIYPR